MLGLREWLFIAFGLAFVAILLWPTDGQIAEGSLRDLSVQELKGVEVVRISGASLSLRLQEDVDRLYVPPTFQISRSSGVLSVSGTSGGVVLGRRVSSLEVSCGTLEVSGVGALESYVFSAGIARFSNFVVRRSGNLTVSAAVLQGAVYVERLDGELIVNLSAGALDLTVFVDERSRSLVRFVGQVPKVRIGW